MRVCTAFNKMLRVPGASVCLVTFTDGGVVLRLRRRARRLMCPCGASSRGCYDRSIRRWRHVDLAGVRLFLEAEIRRVACRACQHVRTEVVPWARPGARHTRDFEDLCAWLAQRTDRTSVASLLRCSWEAVSAIIGRVVADAVDDARLDGIYRIGVDEIRYRHRTFLTLVCDHDTGRVIWIGEGRRAQTLARFYDELGAERASALTVVSCDFGEAYRAATRRAAPDARICFDPFHVTRLANEAVDKVRQQARRLSEDEHLRGRNRRHVRWALLKNEDALTHAQRTVLDDLRRARHVLWRAWVLKEELRDLYRIVDPRMAAAYLRRWLAHATRSRIPQMIDLARTVRAHFDGVVAAVELGVSNARLEGTNSKIRLINHRGYGHHSAASLMAMVLLCCGGVRVSVPLR